MNLYQELSRFIGVVFFFFLTDIGLFRFIWVVFFFLKAEEVYLIRPNLIHWWYAHLSSLDRRLCPYVSVTARTNDHRLDWCKPMHARMRRRRRRQCAVLLLHCRWKNSVVGTMPMHAVIWCRPWAIELLLASYVMGTVASKATTFYSAGAACNSYSSRRWLVFVLPPFLNIWHRWLFKHIFDRSFYSKRLSNY